MSRNLEARLERLERVLRPKRSEPIEVWVIGASRDADGVLREDETHPPIIVRVPGSSNSAVDNPPFFAGG
jgi:hypothetical protein